MRKIVLAAAAVAALGLASPAQAATCYLVGDGPIASGLATAMKECQSIQLASLDGPSGYISRLPQTSTDPAVFVIGNGKAPPTFGQDLAQMREHFTGRVVWVQPIDQGNAALVAQVAGKHQDRVIEAPTTWRAGSQTPDTASFENIAGQVRQSLGLKSQ